MHAQEVVICLLKVLITDRLTPDYRNPEFTPQKTSGVRMEMILCRKQMASGSGTEFENDLVLQLFPTNRRLESGILTG